MNTIDRREFLKTLGLGTVATAAVAAGCTSPHQDQAEGTALGPVPTDQMTYRLDSHGQKVSLLGFGCMRFPTCHDLDSNEQDDPLDQEKINEMLDYAIAHGVNLFDTAPPYCRGRSERAVGLALARHDRSEYLLSSKCSNFAAQSWSREATLKMYHNTFKELQTDYLDYYMLHSVGNHCRDLEGRELGGMEAFTKRYLDNGILDFLVEERAKGKIRNLGFSYHGDVEVFDYLLSRHEEIHWDHVLIQHNYVDWHHAKQLSESNTNSEYLYTELARRDIPVFVMEPLLGGQLASLYDAAVEQLKAREPQASIASWAFRFAGQQEHILTVLSGMTYLEHLQDNIRTYAPHQPLNDEELALLEKIAQDYASFQLIPCTRCQYCMPCPYGIDIPATFSHYNKCLNEGKLIAEDATIETRADRRAFRKARREFLIGYDRSVPKLRQANHCIGCNQCLAHCPQGIPIPQRMKDIDAYVERIRTT